jgi:excisionase family DNA binding protein
MGTNDEIMLFDLSFFEQQQAMDTRNLYSAVVKTLGGFSSHPEDYDDIVTLDILLRQLDIARNEVLRMKKAREERVVSEENPLLNVDEVAQILRVAPETVRNEIKAGKIPSSKVGPRHQERVLKSDLAKYLGVKKIIFTIKDALTD